MHTTTQLDPRSTGVTPRGLAAIVAVALLTTIVVAPIAYFVLLPPILDSTDPMATLSNVSSSQLQLRVAIGLLTVNTVADLVVFWGLYYFLRPAGRALSLLALLFGVAHTVVMTGAVTNLTNLLHMASSDLPAEAFAAQVATETDAFAWAWQAGMVMFGVHLLLRGWLLFAAGYMKKVLGIVMWVVAAGYLVDGFGQILVAGYTGSNPVGWLEVALPVWLIWFVVTSRRPALVTTRPDAGP